ncbi:unnamed protein product [Clonostachys rhizophaga]|uniref:FAD-binding PCMH-type domain-containing protein n=1 Tax=Clonostachys rhizophaga TaxID=160324 RepID=A0A9N9V456_9HYPO|nr:unnamed protein product [Clonostachys rhizophaga]
MRSISLAHILALCLAPTVIHAGHVPSNSCKAFPGTNKWPASSQWDRLNATVSGRLIKPLAPGGVCHPGQPNYNEEECKKLPDEWKTYDWHSRDPVSMMFANWANWACLPDPAAPCSTSGYPAYVVNATTPEDVKAGVDFARENNIRIVVKGTGHDFLGRSNAPGSLSIWTHYLNSITFHSGKFKLTGSDIVIEGDAITAGGGAQMYDLYKAADDHNATIVGGGAKSVGVGGYFTGGGHGILAHDYGLASDNVLEIQVVTPKGKILVVNEAQHSDLFWALRGGGGSTFGVITSITIQAHPTPVLQHINLFAGIPANSTRRDEFLSFMLNKVPDLLDSGLRGYCFLNPLGLPMPIPGLPDGMASFSGALILINKGPEAVYEILAPINATVQERFGGEAGIYSEGVKSYNKWLDWFDVNYDSGTTGGTALMVSRLIDRAPLKDKSDETTQALITAAKAAGLISFYPLGGKGVNEAVPRGGSNSVNPGWRKAYVHTLSALPFTPFNRTSEKEVAGLLDASFEPLRKLTPGLGAYINEASPYEKDPYTTFWGDNYKRLLEIKRRVDPKDVFWCSPCVGNERWKEHEDGRLCKVDPASFRD